MSEIIHIVMWRLNGASAEARNRQAGSIVQAFERSKKDVPGLLRLEVGRNLHEGQDSWDVALYMAFDSAEHLQAYQTNPAHLAIKELVGPMRSSRCQVDFQLGS